MAAYTDQFERRSPFKILPGLQFGGRLSVAIDQATEVLAERGKAEVVRIAECVSRAIDAEALDYGRWHTEHFADVYPDLSAADLAVVREGAMGDLAEQIREEIGELGLFMGIEPALTRQDGLGDEVAFERPEALAVLSLWLAVDCVDLVISEADDTFDRWVSPRRYGAEAAVLAMDAMSASILAVEARERAVDREQVAAAGARADVIAEMVEREEVLRRDRSERGRNASDARWAPREEHIALALEIARSKPFAKWVHAARAIRDEVTKTPDGQDVYTETTIINWLKEAGWTPTKKG